MRPAPVQIAFALETSCCALTHPERMTETPNILMMRIEDFLFYGGNSGACRTVAALSFINRQKNAEKKVDDLAEALLIWKSLDDQRRALALDRLLQLAARERTAKHPPATLGTGSATG